MWTAGVARSVDLSRRPEGAISTEQAALVNNLVTNRCDVHKEGFLTNPKACSVSFSRPSRRAFRSDRARWC